jgi:hypothetical protein
MGRVAAFAAATALLACRQIAGIQDQPSGEPTGACGLPQGTNACAGCAATDCCAESTACAGDPACAAHFQCLGGCETGDWQCRSQCLLDHSPGPSPAYAPLTACLAGKCESACGLTCGGLDYFEPPSAAAACQECLQNNVCAAERASASSAAVVAYGQCVRRCSTPDCRWACALGSDAGAAMPVATGIRDGGLSAGNLIFPIDPASHCRTQCAVGENWTCIGQVTWPTNGNAGVLLLTRVQDAITGTPVAGVQTSLCSFGDSTCSQPLARTAAPTGPSGDVALQTPSQITLGANDAYAQFTFADPWTGDVAANPGGIYPILYFWGYPATQALAPIANPWVLSLTTSEAQQFGDLLMGPDGGAVLNAAFTELGWVGFQVLDCNGVAAPNVSVAIDVNGAREFYFNGILAPSYSLTATDGTGLGGFNFVSPGVATLIATPKGLNRPSSHGQIIVRASAESTLFMYPTP